MNSIETYETLRARAALSGIALEQIESDTGKPSFIATAGAHTKALSSLDEASCWLDRVEAGLTCVTAGGSDE